MLAPYWLFVLGGLFVAVTLFLPRGIVGTVAALVARAQARSGRRGERRRRRDAAPQAGGVSRWTPRTTTALLYLDGVTVSFDGFRALNNLSLAIEPGEMRAIIGPNGAGKTTMMDVITGKTRPDDGDVLFDGTHDLTKLDEAADRRARHRPQVPEADRVRDAHRRGQSAAGAEERPPRRAPRCSGARPPTSASRIDAHPRDHPARDRCASALAGSLSHGQKQWLEIGMLLAQEPKLLLVDEPVAGMTDAETAADRRAAQGDQPRQDRRSWSSTT